MKNRRNVRSVGAIAIIVMAASVISLANVSDAESEISPELMAPFEYSSWEFLGSKVINSNKESQTILLTRAFGSMSKIQLRLKCHFIDIDIVMIHFKNGATQEVQLKPNDLGENFYIINVDGGSQIVKKITVWSKQKNHIDEKEPIDREFVAVWGVPTLYLKNTYREVHYQKVQYNTLDNLTKRQPLRSKKAVILD